MVAINRPLSYILVVLILLMTLQSSSAQNIKPSIVDESSGEPIAFVNIRIVASESGTVSNEKGLFELTLDELLDEDLLRLTHIAFEPIQLSIKTIRSGANLDTIIMKPISHSIKPIEIASLQSKPRILGITKKKCYPIPFYKKASSNLSFPQEKCLFEIGTYFKNEEDIQIDSLEINFSDYLIDSVGLTVKLYTKRNEQLKSIIATPITLIKSGKRISETHIIKLSHLNILIDTDFLVSLENTNEIEKDAVRVLANFKSKGKDFPTYYRNTSQDEWSIMKFKKRDFGLSILAHVK